MGIKRKGEGSHQQTSLQILFENGLNFQYEGRVRRYRALSFKSNVLNEIQIVYLWIFNAFLKIKPFSLFVYITSFILSIFYNVVSIFVIFIFAIVSLYGRMSVLNWIAIAKNEMQRLSFNSQRKVKWVIKLYCRIRNFIHAEILLTKIKLKLWPWRDLFITHYCR